MTNDDDFISRLIGFGLSEKEAQTYLHLLKYGPKTPSPLAKSLKTYREDVHRTLTSLIEKGMVRPSLDAPTVYTAVDLDTALEAALKKHESDLREMEVRKREIQELSRQQHFSPAPEMVTFKIIKSLRELVSVMVPTISKLEKGWDMVVPEQAIIFASQFGINPFTEAFIAEGGRVRVLLTDFSYASIPLVRELVQMGLEVRYLGQEGLVFTVFDEKISMSGINWQIRRFTGDQSIAALWTDDPSYAHYLLSTFEMLWQQAGSAEDRIRQLMEQGPL